MKVDGRIFRGLLDVLGIWAKTGQLIEGSNFCRLTGRGGELLVELPTRSGWLELTVPAEVGDMTCPWAVDLPLLTKVMRAASWPKKGGVGEVEMCLGETALQINVPSWRLAGKTWLESVPSHFSFPRAQGLCWDPAGLPAVPCGESSAAVLLEPSMLAMALEGASHCAASGADRGVLRCVELICSADEVVGLATDGGVVGIASEPAGLPLEAPMSVPVPIAPMRAVLAIWKKAGLGEEVALSPIGSQGQPLLVLSPPNASSFRFVLKLDQGHLPLDALQGLPSSTTVDMGRTADREGLLGQLELAQINPDAKVAWLVWESGKLSIRSHGPLMDLSREIDLTMQPAGDAELAIEAIRLRSALDQLQASGGGDGLIRMAIDSLGRPTRLMLTQVNAATGQVRRVLVLTTAGIGYQAFRERAAERVAEASLAAEKERRRQRFRSPHTDDLDSDD